METLGGRSQHDGLTPRVQTQPGVEGEVEVVCQTAQNQTLRRLVYHRAFSEVFTGVRAVARHLEGPIPGTQGDGGIRVALVVVLYGPQCVRVRVLKQSEE